MNEGFFSFLERPDRFARGEAWMMCGECGARLYSFDGTEDLVTACAYQADGKCQPEHEKFRCLRW